VLPEVKMKADKKMKDDWDGPELVDLLFKPFY
jgi:hypothetical protein